MPHRPKKTPETLYGMVNERLVPFMAKNLPEDISARIREGWKEYLPKGASGRITVGAALSVIETILQEEDAQLLEHAPTAVELDRAPKARDVPSMVDAYLEGGKAGHGVRSFGLFLKSARACAANHEAGSEEKARVALNNIGKGADVLENAMKLFLPREQWDDEKYETLRLALAHINPLFRRDIQKIIPETYRGGGDVPPRP